MDVINKLHPSSDQMKAFFGAPEDGAFIMVNLLRYRDTAKYEDGDRGMTGMQAYGQYAAGVAKCLAAVGAKPLVAGAVTGLMLGEVEDLWDTVALVEYPSLKAFQSMVMSPEYQAITPHRDAGLEGQLNIKIKRHP